MSGRPESVDRRRPDMTLWRLERLRLLRTHRWLVLIGPYLAFGVLGPLTARFFDELMARAGGDITVIAPDPRPVDGLVQFVSNVSQLGLLAVVVVAAAALAVDAHPQRAAFLRTRLSRAGDLVLAPYTVTVVAAVAALTLGTAVTWGLTTALLGGLPAGPMLVGTLYGAVYLAFVVALVAAWGAVVRSHVATIFAAVGTLLGLPLLAMLEVLRPWVPSELLLAVVDLVEGEPARTHLPALFVSVTATVALLLLARRRLEGREL